MGKGDRIISVEAEDIYKSEQKYIDFRSMDELEFVDFLF